MTEHDDQLSEAGPTGRRALRRILRGPVVALLMVAVVAGAGVLAAAVVRPGVERPSPRNAATEQAGEILSLDSLAPRKDAQPDSGADDGATEGRSPRVAQVIGVGTERFSGGVTTNPDDIDGFDPAQAEAPTDAEIRSELDDFRDYIDGVDPRMGGRARIDGKGRLILPKGAPRTVAMVVAAANEIATKPYKWGGGHGAWKDDGYDCSGSVSFALAGARLLDSPLDSSGLMRYGSRGTGRWISIYANPGHVFMTVAGFRFDTSGQGTAGTRWQKATRSTGGFTVRHPTGL